MTSRERVMAAIDRIPADRVPIKHLAVKEIDDILIEYFSLRDRMELLELFGDDLRDIYPDYVGPKIEGPIDAEHGYISASVWNTLKKRHLPGGPTPMIGFEETDEVRALPRVPDDCYDYSKVKERCLQYRDYARVFGYCELDFINGLSDFRGIEQILIDIGLRDPLFIELVDERYQFVRKHIERALIAAEGEIDIVHFGEDLGSQRGLLISPDAFEDLFADKYEAIFALAHKYGAKTMMHCCGSVRGLIPRLAELGLDVLDVVQTFAEGMEIGSLRQDFGDIISFAGTMCVQHVLPFCDPGSVRAEVEKRLHLFSDGGLILGPSHLIQPDTPLENIFEMYRAAGGYRG